MDLLIFSPYTFHLTGAVLHLYAASPAHADSCLARVDLQSVAFEHFGFR